MCSLCHNVHKHGVGRRQRGPGWCIAAAHRYSTGDEEGPTANPTCYPRHGTFLGRTMLQTRWPRRIAARSLARLANRTSGFPRGACATPSGCHSPPLMPLGGTQQRRGGSCGPCGERAHVQRTTRWTGWAPIGGLASGFELLVHVQGVVVAVNRGHTNRPGVDGVSALLDTGRVRAFAPW